MKIVHIAFKYGLKNTGGAAIASTRLHLALIESGIDSHYACVRKSEEGPNLHELPTGWRRAAFLALTKFTRCIWKFTPYRKSICLNVIPLFGLEQLLRRLNPDVVHVQWLNADVASFKQISCLRKVLKPTCKIIVNLHDLFVVLPSGGYPLNRQYIDGLNKKRTPWIERWLFSRKNRMIETLNPVFIGPSEWVCNACRQSIIGRGHEAHTISNIIDPIYRFHPEMTMPHDKFVVLFGCYGGRKGGWKGWPDLVSALKLIPPEIAAKMEVHVFGEEGDNETINGIPVKVLGNVTEPKQMLEIYHQADVFAFPSVQETQGMTKCEALCCGLPVVAFDRTACAEGIEHKVTGWIARDGAVDDFASGICFWADRAIRTDAILGRHIAGLSRCQFDSKSIVDSYLALVGTRAHDET